MRIIGIDPGLVNTGVVSLKIDHEERALEVRYLVVDAGDHAQTAAEWIGRLPESKKAPVFIESYRERGHNYGTNPAMRDLLRDFRTLMPRATVLDNMGVKKIVRPPLLRVLGLHKFPTTNHRDLESAARILVLGMLKDDDLNRVLTQVLEKHLGGTQWALDIGPLDDTQGEDPA